MNRFLTTLAALALCGPAFAQTQTPMTPARAEKVVRKADKTVQKAEQKVDQAQRAPTGDEELALAALEGLMAQPEDRALPILKKVLAGSQTPVVKQRALFVLSQIDSPEARQILAEQSRSPDAAMRSEAIRSIGIGGDPKLLDGLQQTYAAGDSSVKQEVLQAWMIAGRKESIYQAAVNAKTEEEAAEAIRLLGALGATEELRKLSDKPKAAGSLVDAYAISGDLASLRKIADGNADREVRLNAVRKIGIIGSDEARTALRSIYSGSTDAEIREAALQGLLISGDEKGVMALYQSAKTGEEKRVLLRYLSMMDGDAALQAIDAALEGKK